MPKTTDDNFHLVVGEIVEKYLDNPQKCFSKLMEVKYPNSDTNIELYQAKFFYEKYAKLLMDDIKIDKDFTKNAYNRNKKIFSDTHLK
jgi:hypothetical protein